MTPATAHVLTDAAADLDRQADTAAATNARLDRPSIGGEVAGLRRAADYLRTLADLAAGVTLPVGATTADRMRAGATYIGTHEGPTTLVGRRFTFHAALEFQPDPSTPALTLLRATVTLDGVCTSATFAHGDVVTEVAR